MKHALLRTSRPALLALALALGGAPLFGPRSVDGGPPPACRVAAAPTTGGIGLVGPHAATGANASFPSGWRVAEPRPVGATQESGPRPSRRTAPSLGPLSESTRSGRSPHTGRLAPRAAFGLLGLGASPANAPPGS